MQWDFNENAFGCLKKAVFLLHLIVEMEWLISDLILEFEI